MPHIACLHTAQSNVAVFDAALRDLGLAEVTLRHAVRPDLLAEAERAHGLTPEITTWTQDALRALCDGSNAVLLTCSTLGPAVAAMASAPCPVLRADAALAAEAVREGGRVVVLCAVETTIVPTRLVFEDAARRTGATVTLRLVPGAWDAFRAGQTERYLTIIARAAEAACQQGATRVALAQASMAGAAPLARTDPPPLSSPTAGLRAAVAAMGSGSARADAP
jgi:hypothetical protein